MIYISQVYFKIGTKEKASDLRKIQDELFYCLYDLDLKAQVLEFNNLLKPFYKNRIKNVISTGYMEKLDQKNLIHLLTQSVFYILPPQLELLVQEFLKH